MVRPFTVNALLVAAASFPVTWALVRALDYKGGALATTATTTFQFALDVGYVVFSGVWRETWRGVNLRKAVKGLRPMLWLSMMTQLMFGAPPRARRPPPKAAPRGGAGGRSPPASCLR